MQLKDVFCFDEQFSVQFNSVKLKKLAQAVFLKDVCILL